MFTDDQVTPVRLEIFIDLLRANPNGLARKDVYRLLQPKSFDPDPNFGPAKATLNAATELGLAEDIGGRISLSGTAKREENARLSIFTAFDEMVLSTTKVESYFALFYAYYLNLGRTVCARSNQKPEDWAKQFNEDVFLGEPQPNPFNPPKLTGLHRWFDYVGLGWYDPASNFQANPYERLLRVFPKIFSPTRKLSSEEFMKKLAIACPELDGGEIFCKANRDWKSSDKICSLGLSHALIELHEDEIVRLDCPADAQGWTLKEAEPPRDDSFKDDRFVSVEWRKK